jgi:phosphate:Na+ symporter
MINTSNYFLLAFELLGSLGLLIFGMKMMSDSLQKLAGPQLRHILARITSNRFSGILAGTSITCAVQSSSATTVMTVSFVSAGLLTLSQAISVIMGANIGTTLTAWIMSLGYNVDLTVVVFPAFFFGLLLIYNKRFRFAGDLLYGTAFVFFSLVLLSATGKAMDLEHNETVINFFSSFDTSSYSTILIFLALGTIITCVVQSSAAVMAITILLCSTGVLPIHMGIALVMGENIGTTATANIAALGAGTQARRAALAHLLFNLIGVTWVLCVFYPFVDLVCQLAGYDSSNPAQQTSIPIVLATFHTCFNVTNTALLIGFVPQIERLVCWLLPEHKEEEAEDGFKLKYLHSNLMKTPEIMVLQAQKETTLFAQKTQDMFGLVRQLLNEKKTGKREQLISEIEKQEDIADKTEIGIARYLEHISDDHLSSETKNLVRALLREISELESIADSCYNMSRQLKRQMESGKEFTDDQYHQLQAMTIFTNDALTQMNVVMSGHVEDHTIDESYRIENMINLMCKRLKEDNIKAVDEHKYDYSIGTMYTDIVKECEKLGDYIINVMQARFGK